MSKEFEAEVKKVKPRGKQPADKRKTQPDVKKANKGASTEPAKPEDSPLKTVGGTPIIERQEG